MTLQVVGAGLGRTGTASLKIALEQLLGGPCYHMLEVFGHPEHVRVWTDASRGEATDWSAVFDGYEATVDWPAAAFWSEIAAAYPDAIILLSTRPADEWWRSADRTILESFRRPVPEGMEVWREMADALFQLRFTPDFLDPAAAMAAFEQHNADVRATAPADRLVEWQPGDGWKPICDALGVPVPDDPFPHANTTDEFRGRAGYDA